MLTYSEWNAYMLQMLQLGLFDVAYDDENHLKITPFGEDVLYGRATVQFTKWTPPQTRRPKKKAKEIPTVHFTAEEQLFELLRLKRLELARAADIPPYQVFSDKVLHVMAAEKPVTQDQFATMYGVGEYKAQRYWQPFTQLIAQWKSQPKAEDHGHESPQ